MKKTKFSKKKKALFSIAGIVLTALVILAIIAIVNPKPKTTVKLAEVAKGEIVQTLEKSATVESADSTNYPILDGVKVLTVDVALGDTVKTGDKLATFDVSSLSGIVGEKEADYENAKTLYENAVSTVAEAKTKIPELEKEVAALEKEVASLESSSTEQTTSSDSASGSLLERIESAFSKGISDIGDIFGSGSLDDITGMLNGSIIPGNTELSKKQIELAEAKGKLLLMELQVQLNIGKSYYKSIMESKYADLQVTKLTVEQLKNGWTATSDGVITDIRIEAGKTYVATKQSSPNLDLTQILSSLSGGTDISTLLASLMSSAGGASAEYGMTLDGYDGFVARFTVGESDAQNVKVGQKVTIKSKTNTFTGTINYISAKATSSAGMDINSITSVLTGSTTTNSLEATATIDNPDQSIIIGFNVDVDIELDKKEDVLLVPVEVVQLEEVENSQVKYVFVYDEAKGRIFKREIETGILSDTTYQILIGLEEGEKVVKGVNGGALKDLEDEEKVVVEA